MIIITIIKFIYILVSKKRDVCIQAIKTAHSHTHTYMCVYVSVQEEGILFEFP